MFSRPVFACLIALVLTAAARADFMLVSQDMKLNSKSATADFTLTFNQKPDFLTVDPYGRPANSFQIDFNGHVDSTAIKSNVAAGYGQDITAVVRGDEIRYADALRIRSSDGYGGPTSGGWGPVTGTVPYRLVDNTLTFSAPIKTLGVTGDGFHYTAFSLAYGDLTAQISSTMIPTPTAAVGGVAGLAVVFVLVAWMKRRQRTRLA